MNRHGPSARDQKRGKAVFLDRDGVLNELVYYPDEGIIRSPMSVKDIRVFPFAGESVCLIKGLNYKAIVVSNQPGVAKRQFTLPELRRMNNKVRRELSRQGCSYDAEYFCLHHPDALLKEYKVDCDCRKPKPGLLVKAANEHDLDLSKSFFVGDAIVDMKAGNAAGCRTILLGHVTTFFSEMLDREGVTPDFIVPSLKDVPKLLEGLQPRN